MNTLLADGLSLLLQSTLLLGLGLWAAHGLRRRGPVLQSALCRAALASVALAALSSALVAGHVRPLWRVALPAQAPSVAVQAITPPTPAEIPPAPNFGRARVGAGSPRPSPPVPPELGVRGSSSPVPPLSGARGPAPVLYSLLTGIWATGTLGLLFWLLACHVHVSRLRRRSIVVTEGPAADALRELCAAQSLSPPRLLASVDVQSPFLTGLWRPAIVLPASYQTDFAPDALRAILSHELAHLERRDCAWTLLARLTCAGLWMQPLLWLVCRRMEHAAEEACDQAVLARHADPRAYADCLLSLAERLTPSRLERAVGAGVVPFRSSLGRRIQHILERKQIMPALSLPTRVALALAAVSAAALLPILAAPVQVNPPAAKPTALVGLAVVLNDNTPAHSEADASSSVRHIYGKGEFLSVIAQTGTEYVIDEPDRVPAYVAQADVHLLDAQQLAQYRKISLDDDTVSFLDKQVAETRQKMRKAEQALGAYRQMTGRATPAAKRKLTELTRSYALQSDLYNQLIQQRTQKKTFADWDKLNFQASLSAAPLAPNQIAAPLALGQDPLAQARFMAGLTAVQGPGVVVTLNDSKKPFPSGMPSGMAPPNIIHDADINQVVNELKASGAEAIAVNDQRLVATSSIRSAGPTVYVNNTPQTPPFVIKAIGDPKTLEYVVTQPGRIATQIRQFDPAMIKIAPVDHLVLPAYTDGNRPRFAQPMP